MSSQKRNTLTVKHKLEIFEAIESGRSRKSVQSQYAIGASTLSSILKHKEKIHDYTRLKQNLKTSRIKPSPYENINIQVINLVKQARLYGIYINGPIMQRKALEIARKLGITEFSASSGWISNLRKSYPKLFPKLDEEPDEFTNEDIQKWLRILPSITKDYNPKDIYSMCGTGIFIDRFPDSNFSFIEEDDTNDNSNHKDRITVILSCNMTGDDKLDILIIGKLVDSVGIRGVESLPLTYKANQDGLMSISIFDEWIHKLDLKMTEENRKIILFMQHSPVHPKASTINLQSVKVVFFPAYITSELQPLTLGIIKSLKYYYRKELIDDFVKALEEFRPYQPPNPINTLHTITQIWQQRVSSTTIQNCFKRSGFDEYQANPSHLNSLNLALDSLTSDPNLPFSFSGMNPRTESFDLPAPLSWRKLLEFSHLNIPFSKYVDIDANADVFQKISIDDLIVQPEPELSDHFSEYEPSVNDDAINEERTDQTILNISKDKIEAIRAIDDELTSVDKALEILFEALIKKRNTPKEAFKALNYIEAFFK